MRNHQVMNQSKFTWNAFGNFQHISSTEGKNICSPLRQFQAVYSLHQKWLESPTCKVANLIRKHESSTNCWQVQPFGQAGERNNSTPTSNFSGLVTSHPRWWLWSCRILHLFPSRFWVECAANEILKRQARPCPPAVLAGCGYYVGHPAKRFDALCQFQVQIFHDFSICHQHVVFIYIYIYLFPVSLFNLQTEHIQKKNEDFTTTQYLLF